MLRCEAKIPDVQKIAVLRANVIGDFVFAVPALHALRAAYPEAEIVFLGQSWHQRFLTGRPGPIDRVEVVPPCKGVNDASNEPPGDVEAFLRRMREEEFDLALQLHGGGRHSNPFVRRLGARLTAGLKAPESEPLDRWIPYIYFQQEYMRWLEAVALVGAPPVTLAPQLTVTERDVEESYSVVGEEDGPLVAMHPGAGDPRRRWPPEKFALVADRLSQAGARVVLTGVADEAPLALAVQQAMRAEAIIASGRLSLGGFGGLVARSQLVVSNDSGPLHLAIAFGAPTVGIYWCFNMFTATPLTRSDHRPFVSWQINCPICGTGCVHGRCEHDCSLVAEISEHEVAEAALELFHGVPGRPRPAAATAQGWSARSGAFRVANATGCLSSRS